jgi:hypothetical protein
VDRAQQFVEVLALTLPLALQITRRASQVAQLQEALASRSTIEQALGVPMAQNRCTRDDAFGLLRRASQNRNIKLRDVASAIIHRFSGHQPPPPPPFHPADPEPAEPVSESHGPDPTHQPGVHPIR